MKAVTTRTLNPLPFQDLEPHRFEDLVRQLAYDLRRWKSLEATGRGGTDEGLDIRAIELVRIDEEPDEDDEIEVSSEERLWIFQCKREKVLAPKRLRKVIQESLVSQASLPYGFVLAIACDVSKKTRDTFREEMVNRGIEEFAIWTKSELEDMLFQPRNDRLLFAYFGLSLQPRRRSVSTTLRSQIARKKQLTTLLQEDQHQGKLILLRDPADDRYPREPKTRDPAARWLACRATSLKSPGHLVVLRHEHLAATTPDATKWDAISDYDLAEVLADGDLRAVYAWGRDEGDRLDRTPQDFWNEYIAEPDRAYLKVYRAVALDRILAIDVLGDGYFPIPHVFVEFDDTHGPFEPRERAVLERAGVGGERLELVPENTNRARIFPQPLPGAFDPPPKGFDDTGNVTLPLTLATDDKLKAVLASVTARRKPGAGETEAAKASVERVHSKMRPFREWRDSVARPVFAAFVARLRAAGQDARVVVRSVGPSDRRHEAAESVELRVQLQGGSAHNPSYRPSGHVRLSVSEYSQWRMDVWPTADEPRRGHGAATPPKLEGMAKDELEAQVLMMLERLTSAAY